MNFFILEPEVAGGFGPDTVLNHDVHPPRPIYFDYRFDGWLGDSLVETVANFIVTLPLKDKLEKAHATGITFGEVKVSKSGEFEDLYPKVDLPRFAWMQVKGVPGNDDFGLSNDHRLVVSSQVLDLLKEEVMHCEIRPYVSG